MSTTANICGRMVRCRRPGVNQQLHGRRWLYIHGDIHTDVYDEDENAANGTQDRPFMINGSRGVLDPPDPNAPEEELPIEYAPATYH